jgi:LysR family transcriptional regulator, regulator for metE and metH
MIDIQQLQLVAMVSQEASVTKAAEKLFLTQPAISHQIKELEQKLGISVFDRVGKKLIPTEVGRVMIAAYATIKPQIDGLDAAIQAIKEGKSQTIRISSECHTCYNWLPEVIKAFQLENRQIHVQIVAEATQKPLQYLKEGNLDIAIVSQITENHHYDFMPLFSDRLVAVLPKNHELVKANQSISASDLVNENIIRFSSPTDNSWVMQVFFSKYQPKTVQQIQLTEAIIEMVNAGLGITIVANWIAEAYKKTKNIAILPLSDNLGERTWYAVKLKTAEPKFDMFIDKIVKSFGKNKRG